MFLAVSETPRFTRSDGAPGQTQCKNERLKLSFSSFFSHVTAQSLSMSITEDRVYAALVFAFKLRLNNRLHLYWYHPRRHCAVKAAVLFVVMYVSSFAFAVLQTTHNLGSHWMINLYIYFLMCLHIYMYTDSSCVKIRCVLFIYPIFQI